MLDTTYLLPAIGVAIKNLSSDEPIRLIRKGHQLFLSDISIFELSAKGAKYIAARKLLPDRVVRGMRAIVYDETLEIVSSYESTVLSTAFRIRSVLTDFIDCLILSSAISQCDILVTEDTDIQDLKRSKEFVEMLNMVNPEFKIHKLSEIL
jgi:predicted nucleic acid-binding protein